MQQVAVVGAGVSGLTCGLLFAERRYPTTIFAQETGPATTSGAAAAIWFPYDAKPAEKVIRWALQSYKVFLELAKVPGSGVSMIELRQYSRSGPIAIPEWAIPLGARALADSSSANESDPVRDRPQAGCQSFHSGFALAAPLMDTTIYLPYLTDRFVKAGGKLNAGVRFEKLEEVSSNFDLVINCTGIGARVLMEDVALEPHRGQVAVVQKIRNLHCAIVCDDAPFMYAVPRENDCVFGGTNEISDNLEVDPSTNSRIVAECSRVLQIARPRVIDTRVGLRPFRKSGVRLERDRLPDGRTVVHNYGHGGSGFTVSWGCASAVLALATT